MSKSKSKSLLKNLLVLVLKISVKLLLVSLLETENVTSILRLPKPPDYSPNDPPALNFYSCELVTISEHLSFGVYIEKGM